MQALGGHSLPLRGRFVLQIYIWFVVDEPKELQTEREPRRSLALLHSPEPNEISTSRVAHVLVEEKVFSPSKRVGAVSALCKVQMGWC